MPRPSSGTRKEAAFVVLSVCVITIFSIFILAAAKIGRELKARIVVFWCVLLRSLRPSPTAKLTHSLTHVGQSY